MIAQVGIAVFGVAAIFLVTGSDARMRAAGCACGLCSQPFWLWTTWENGQWGIFALSVFYAYSWGRGLRNNIMGDVR